MIVRQAGIEELDAVGELTRAAYVDGGLVPAESDYAAELSDATQRYADAILLVAADDSAADAHDRLLGTVTYCPGGTSMAETSEPGEAEFRMLGVRKSARGRGVGESLVRSCVARARATHNTVLRLSTGPDMHTAHRLYERLGFYRTPELDWYPHAEIKLFTYALDLV